MDPSQSFLKIKKYITSRILSGTSLIILILCCIQLFLA